MSVKKKLITSYILMALIPIALITVAGIMFLFFFMVTDGVTLTDIRLMRFQDIVVAMVVRYGFMLIFIALVAIVGASFAVTYYVSKSILTPLNELRAAAVNIKKGNLNYKIITSKDKEINELCMAFEEMRLKLKDSANIQARHEKEKNMLIANISHDIRTPVTSIKGYVEGIADGVADTPEKVENYLKTIFLKAEIIDELVENLSLFSKLELKRLTFNFSPVDVNKLLINVLDVCEIDLQRDSMKLECNLSEYAITVNADGDKLKRVFLNIIGNAIKYKQDSEGTLIVSSTANDKGIFIEFKDNGIGVAKEEAEHVFDGFYRADRSRNSQIKGHGLGLAIAKQIIEAHEGKIWMKLNEGSGITVVIYLPA